MVILVLGYAVLLKYAGWIIFAIATYYILKAGVPALRSWRAARRYQRLTEREQAAIYNAQIDRENREWIEAGLYEGNYPAMTMPLNDVYVPPQVLYAEDAWGWPTKPLNWQPEDWKLPPDWSGIVRPK